MAILLFVNPPYPLLLSLFPPIRLYCSYSFRFCLFTSPLLLSLTIALQRSMSETPVVQLYHRLVTLLAGI